MSTATLTDNAATVAKLYAAFGRGDIPFIVSHLADDCRWIGIGEGSLPQAGTYIGKDALNFFIKLGQAEEFTAFNVEGIHNIENNQVVAYGNASGVLKATGKKFSSDWMMHWKFNDEGKAIYFQDFFDTAAVYRASLA